MNLITTKKTLLILILVLNINTFLAQTTPSVQAPIEELNILTTNEILKDKGTLVALCRSQNGTSKPVNINGKIYFAAKQTYKKTDTAKTKPFFITYDGMILEGGDCKYSYSLNEEGRHQRISGVTFVDLNLPYTDISNNATFLPKSQVYFAEKPKTNELKSASSQDDGKIRKMQDTEVVGCISGNCINGYGKYIYRNGDEYEGYFVDSKSQGFGIYKWPDGKRYEGDFINDEIQGHGIIHYSNGYKYEGDFINGEKQGIGKITIPSGEIINVKSVNGKMVPYNSNCIIGDCYNGYGKFKDSNGVYEGNFVDGGANGEGVFIFMNGDRYEGSFVNGKANGQGKITYYASGVVKEGKWVNNSLSTKSVSNDNNNNPFINYLLGNMLGKIADSALNTLNGSFSSYSSSGSSSSYSSSSGSSRPSSNNNSSECNKKFKFRIWKGGQYSSGNYWGGWADEETSKPGFVKCPSCNGYGVNWDYDNNEGRPRSKKCYNNSCNGGWVPCNH